MKPSSSGDQSTRAATPNDPSVAFAPAPELLTEDEAEHLVEEAEQMLREAAPHDYEVLVIGAGPAGCTAAIRAAQLGAKVGLIEAQEIGGAHLRCSVPLQSFLDSAHLWSKLQDAIAEGVLRAHETRLDFAAMHRRKDEIVQQQRQTLQRRLNENKIELLRGRGRFKDQHTVEITDADGQTRAVRAVHVIIATGARAVVHADSPGVLTPPEILGERGVPEHLVIIGANTTGIEFAQLYRVLGARVTLLESARCVLPQADEDISIEIGRVLKAQGVEIFCHTNLQTIEPDGDTLQISFKRDGSSHTIKADRVLCMDAWAANIEDLGLDIIGVATKNGCIEVDETGQTNAGGVYAVGACADSDESACEVAGWLAAEAALDYPGSVGVRFAPSRCRTRPEIAAVGLTARQAKAQDYRARDETASFQAEGEKGFIKIVADEDSRLLGCQIIGPRATELIGAAVMVLKAGQTVEEWRDAVQASPALNGVFDDVWN